MTTAEADWFESEVTRFVTYREDLLDAVFGEFPDVTASKFDAVDKAHDAIGHGRMIWRRIPAAVAARDCPDHAVDELRELSYTVTEPHAGAAPARTVTLSAWCPLGLTPISDAKLMATANVWPGYPRLQGHHRPSASLPALAAAGPHVRTASPMTTSVLPQTAHCLPSHSGTSIPSESPSSDSTATGS